MSSKFQTGGLMMVMLFGLMFGSGTDWVSAEEQKKEGAGDVKERAVPPHLIPKTEGVVIQGNQLTAMPGYQLQLGPNNTVSAMRNNGGLGFSGECACVGTGACYEKQTTNPPTVSCLSDSSNACNGSCAWVNQSPNAAFRGAAVGGAIGGRLQTR